MGTGTHFICWIGPHLDNRMAFKLKRKNKFGNIRTARGFPSKLEEAVYDLLLLRERAGEIRNIQRQKTIVLQDGGKAQRIAWRVDFAFEEKTDIFEYWETGWRPAFSEAKGMETETYRIKLKLFRANPQGKLYIYKGTYSNLKLVEVIE